MSTEYRWWQLPMGEGQPELVVDVEEIAAETLEFVLWRAGFKPVES